MRRARAGRILEVEALEVRLARSGFRDEVALARLASSATGTGATVAILDSGIDYLHPALGGSFRGPTSRVIDGYDFVDGRSGNFSEGDPTPGPDADPMDENGHGTSLATIIGGSDPNYGGLAPDTRFVALRVLDQNNRGSWDWIDAALDWVLDHRASDHIVAVNLSLGDGVFTDAPSFPSIDRKLEALWSAGVAIVAAAGNEFYSNGSQPGLGYPAVNPHTISVGAVYDGDYGPLHWANGAIDYSTALDRVASFSQRGPDLDLVAPGGVITTATLSNGGQRRWAEFAGTSQAAAFVTGALVLERQTLEMNGRAAEATPDHLRDLLIASSRRVIDGDDEQDNVVNTGLSFARVDVAASLLAAGRAPLADANEPNNSQAKASFLGAASTWSIDRTIHVAGDVDWYRFQVPADGTYHLQLETPLAATLTFRNVIRGKEQTIVARVTGGVAQMDLALRRGVNYFLEVAGNGAQVGRYALGLGDPPPVVIVPPPPTPDRFEANESQSAARFAGVVQNTTLANLSLHTPTDVDWFRFQVSANLRLRIEITADRPVDGASITFMDVTRGRERSITATMVDGTAAVDVDVRAGVNYFLHANAAGTPLGYQIRFAPVTIAARGMTADSIALAPSAIDSVLGEAADL